MTETLMDYGTEISVCERIVGTDIYTAIWVITMIIGIIALVYTANAFLKAINDMDK